MPCLIYADLLLGDRPPPLIDCNSDGGPDEHDEELEFHLDFTDDSSSENENMSLSPNPASKENISMVKHKMVQLTFHIVKFVLSLGANNMN